MKYVKIALCICIIVMSILLYRMNKNTEPYYSQVDNIFNSIIKKTEYELNRCTKQRNDANCDKENTQLNSTDASFCEISCNYHVLNTTFDLTTPDITGEKYTDCTLDSLKKIISDSTKDIRTSFASAQKQQSSPDGSVSSEEDTFNFLTYINTYMDLYTKKDGDDNSKGEMIIRDNFNIFLNKYTLIYTGRYTPLSSLTELTDIASMENKIYKSSEPDSIVDDLTIDKCLLYKTTALLTILETVLKPGHTSIDPGELSKLFNTCLNDDLTLFNSTSSPPISNAIMQLFNATSIQTDNIKRNKDYFNKLTIPPVTFPPISLSSTTYSP